MALIESINRSRQKGISDADILKTIETAVPASVVGFKTARGRGANDTAIIDELIKRHSGAVEKTDRKSRIDELRDRISRRGEKVPTAPRQRQLGFDELGQGSGTSMRAAASETPEDGAPAAQPRPDIEIGERPGGGAGILPVATGVVRVGVEAVKTGAQQAVSGFQDPFQRETFGEDVEATKTRAVEGIKTMTGGLSSVGKGIKEGFADIFTKGDPGQAGGKIARGLTDVGLGAVGTVFSVIPTILPDEAEAVLNGVFGAVGGTFEGGMKQFFKEVGINPEGEDARRLVEIAGLFGKAKTAKPLATGTKTQIASRFTKEGKRIKGATQIRKSIKAGAKKGRTEKQISKDMKTTGEVLVREGEIPKGGEFNKEMGREVTPLESMEQTSIPNAKKKIWSQVEALKESAGKKATINVAAAEDLLRGQAKKLERTPGGKEKQRLLNQFADDIAGVERAKGGEKIGGTTMKKGDVLTRADQNIKLEGAENIVKGLSDEINKVGARTSEGRALIKVKKTMTDQLEDILKGSGDLRNEYRALNAVEQDLIALNKRIGNETPFTLMGQGGRVAGFSQLGMGALDIVTGKFAQGFDRFSKGVAILTSSKFLEKAMNPNLRLEKGFELLQKGIKGSLKPKK